MQTYKIAGIIVEMDIKYNRLKKQAIPYIYNGKEKAQITLEITEKVMEKARLKFPELDDEGLEYLLYGALFYDKLLDFGGMMLHSSAVAVDGRAYLFSANSGVGKSTHTAFWKELLPNAVIVNDDKPAIRYINGNLYVYGTPFSGKCDMSVNGRFLLGGICFLSRGQENEICEIEPKEALPLFLAQSFGMHQAKRVEKRLSVTDKVLSNTKLYKMKCIKDISAAKTAYEKMRVSVPVTLGQLLPIIDEVLESGMSVTFLTNGYSMCPLLNNKESVTIIKSNTYKKKDVILFRREDSTFVLHRIIKIKGDTYYTEGDALAGIDKPIKQEQILGKATAFIKGNKTINEGDFSYKIYKLLYVSAIGRKLRKLKRKLRNEKNGKN